MKIELKNISLVYDGKEPLFKGISFVIEKGDFLLIQGASGVGKSSLLRLLNRLQEPTMGEILIEGNSIIKYEVTALRRKIGYIQQSPVMISGSVEDNLKLAFRFRSARSQEPPDIKEIQKLMNTFLLNNIKPSDDAGKLSLGQKQRIAIIRTLITKPEVLICDEPTSALDHTSKEIVEESLERLNMEENMSIILVTHYDFLPKKIKAKKILLRADGLKRESL